MSDWFWRKVIRTGRGAVIALAACFLGMGMATLLWRLRHGIPCGFGGV